MGISSLKLINTPIHEPIALKPKDTNIFEGIRGSVAPKKNQ